MAYNYGGSYSAAASGSSLASTSHAPITRSRTGLFLSYRDTVIRSSSNRPQSRFTDKGKGKARAYDLQGDDGEEQEGLLAMDRGQRENGRHEVIQMNQLPPQWIDEADRVDDILDRLKPKLAQLDKLHSKHVLPGFSDKTAEEREIASLTSDITRELRKCQNIIMKIAQYAKNLPLSTTTKEDRVMIQNVQTALATKVQEASAIFRKKQSNYLKQLRGYELRNQDILAASGAIAVKDSYASMNDDIELSQDTLATSSLQLASQVQAQEQETGLSLEAINQRDREITSIAESISDLAMLFKDLSTMVIDQGTMLDRIDYNVESMANDMESAVKELNTATKYQRRSGKRQIICLLILLIIGAIIVLVYKPKRHSTHAPVVPPVQEPPAPSLVRQRMLW
ncbi:t-SNARE [Cystobasidium minutum MCA 4210]|uniref:t-SNARE n=1 Tax=Cystobasidium minutum MCA 4210 TaxID=1397322 RepID=UPI0034CE32F6|eukprot:jgi/Rhomi1/208729/estExt_Genemark1.C_2_t10458